jgi:hypothetical protein
MIIKNLDLQNLLKMLPLSIGARFLAILRQIKKRNIIRIILDLKALLWPLKELEHLLKWRWITQKKIRNVSDEEILIDLINTFLSL